MMTATATGKAPRITKKSRKEAIQNRLRTDDRYVYEAIGIIHSRQTADEQAYGQTKHDNQMGWSGVHAEFMTSMADNIKKWGSLRPKQMTYARKYILHYADQLVAAEDEKAREAQEAQDAANAMLAESAALKHAHDVLGAHILAGLPVVKAQPVDIEAEERAMMRMEAEWDRAETERDESRKAYARLCMENPNKPMPDYHDWYQNTLAGKTWCVSCEYCDGEGGHWSKPCATCGDMTIGGNWCWSCKPARSSRWW